jgi:hypothetical protein
MVEDRLPAGPGQRRLREKLDRLLNKDWLQLHHGRTGQFLSG